MLAALCGLNRRKEGEEEEEAKKKERRKASNAPEKMVVEEGWKGKFRATLPGSFVIPR